jgi:polyphosphate kinase 2 (PPK2 family)
MKTKHKEKKKKKDDPGKASGANGKAETGLQIGDVKAETHKVKSSDYEAELARLQIELVKLQEWIKHEGSTRTARACAAS